jgi:chemotaxis protein methyltransferase CheR
MVAGAAAARDAADFETFRKRARSLTGLDLRSYKAPQMHRRLSALLVRHRIASFADYARLLETDEQRRQEFRDFVTINVSEFFRDRDRFDELERHVLPKLLEGTGRVRVWSAGCSMGAEPYSLAILLNELAPGGGHAILATDVDRTILARARAGTGHLATELRNAGAQRIRRWFVPTLDGRFSVSPAVRAGVRFVHHDLLDDRYPRGPFDLIACRNVAIYFTEGARERVYRRCVAALRPGGVLFVGAAEGIRRPHALGLVAIDAGLYRYGDAG